MTDENKTKMVTRLKSDLSVNFKDGDDSILSDFIDDYISIASNNSNRRKDDEKLYPYVYNAVKSAYLKRGDEGSSSATEGSLSTSYIDIEEKLAKDVRAVRVVK
ncbi:MAG: hypothetical protein OSJ70_10525 [Bacilli bacterium]|nr:hypothetical protein [Bacilli bacterium]